MSVRRLHHEQPESFRFTPASEEQVQFWLGKYPQDRQRSAVIPLLWIAQKQEGWVSEPAIRAIAERLAMPAVRVLEVATFYTMFHLHPVGRHHLQVCGTTPCMLRGAERLKEVCRRRIGPKQQPSADGLFSWEEVECLGACVNAPVVAIEDYYHEDLTPEALEDRIEALARGERIEPGSALGRFASAPEGGPKVLLDESLYDGSLGQPLRLPERPAPVEEKT